MSHSVAAQTSQPGPLWKPPQNSLATPAPVATLPPTSPSVDASPIQDEVAHMRRRLFRTLDDPELPMTAVDCSSVASGTLSSLGDRFFADEDFRHLNNLVIAVPTTATFAESPDFDAIQQIKQTAFEMGLEGKVSWLLIETPETELPALQTLVAQQGGQWYQGT
ncbi:hypothetical protein [Neorhodopirellula lusitana]|uniref:hypothetical protein n=1 Tax=Neorhodopirellula lusitana TaxID=445327 RepID=UPI00384B29D3